MKLKNKNKKTETVVFDNGSDLLIAMIGGRYLAYEGRRYYFSKKLNVFEYAHGSETPIELRRPDDGIHFDPRFLIESIDKMCEILVGEKLTDIEPEFIPVDTLIFVSNHNHNGTHYKKRYFSHWHKGKVYTFKDGATSDTQDGTEKWLLWKPYLTNEEI